MGILSGAKAAKAATFGNPFEVTSVAPTHMNPPPYSAELAHSFGPTPIGKEHIISFDAGDLASEKEMAPVVINTGMSTGAKIGIGIGMAAATAASVGAGIGIGYLVFHGDGNTTNENTYIVPDNQPDGEPVPDWLM